MLLSRRIAVEVSCHLSDAAAGAFGSCVTDDRLRLDRRERECRRDAAESVAEVEIDTFVVRRCYRRERATGTAGRVDAEPVTRVFGLHGGLDYKTPREVAAAWKDRHEPLIPAA